MRWVLVVVVVAGCWRGEPGPASPQPDEREAAEPASNPAPCKAVAANTVRLRIGNAPEGISTAVARRCHDDRWSLQLRRCIVTSTTFDDGKRCLPLFLPVQLDALARDLAPLGMQVARDPFVPATETAPGK